MYKDMYGSTFVGKQLTLLQEVKDFYSEQVSGCVPLHVCTGNADITILNSHHPNLNVPCSWKVWWEFIIFGMHIHCNVM